jgi:DNA-directed RNA polymerase subunit RPC12/RpoP
MALITCKNCEREFPKDGARCAHCGVRKNVRLRVFFVVLALFLYLGIMAAVFMPHQKDAPALINFMGFPF